MSNIEEIEAAARQQGWLVTRTRRGHRRLIPPDKTRAIVIGAGTCSDKRRGWRQLVRDARRSGLVWPPPKRLPLKIAKDRAPQRNSGRNNQVRKT